MLFTLFRLALSAVFLVAAAFLATRDSADHEFIRILCATFVALPSLWQFLDSFGELLGSPNRETRTQVKRTLQGGLVELYDKDCFKKADGTHRANLMHVSLHVWLVPTWYRIIVPFRLRSKLSDERRARLPGWIRPPIKRFVKFRFEHRPPSKVRFRKGKGVIGRCVETADVDRTHIATFDSNSGRQAIRSEADWKRAPVSVTQNLRFQEAKRLSTRYSQVLAFALCNNKGDAIGCLTFSFARARNNGLIRDAGDPLLAEMKSLARQVQDLLT